MAQVRQTLPHQIGPPPQPSTNSQAMAFKCGAIHSKNCLRMRPVFTHLLNFSKKSFQPKIFIFGPHVNDTENLVITLNEPNRRTQYSRNIWQRAHRNRSMWIPKHALWHKRDLTMPNRIYFYR